MKLCISVQLVMGVYRLLMRDERIRRKRSYASQPPTGYQAVALQEVPCLIFCLNITDNTHY